MKYYVLIFAILLVTVVACNETNKSDQHATANVDSIENNAPEIYRPGLGEFMSGIQVHHAKLWFAGKNLNWQLADFETKEIKEALENINIFCRDRMETKSIGMIDAPMDSIGKAIEEKDVMKFQNRYKLLTSACNDCHKATNHGYNVIKTPDTPPYSNQVF